jgi:hypothetical protein
VRTEQADQIARGGLDFVVGNMEGEIQDGTFSTTTFGTAQSPFYVPNAPTNAFPMRMVPIGTGSTNILLTSANTAFYTGGQTTSPTMASSIPSTNSSLNNQVITASDWNKPMLVPPAPANLASMPIPNWVFVSRTGPVSVSSGATYSTVTPNLSNLSGVIGRYAFVVYDTSGLLDINVAGYDPSQASMTANAPGKGLLPYADLTQLPGINASDATALVHFRNTASETNFPLALTNTSGPNMVSNGFMQVYAPTASGPSDTTFLSRQEFLQFANNNPDWTNALPYLTTFSRELNGPTWGPTANTAAYTFNTTNYSFPYLSTATNSTTSTSTTTINPDIYAPRVPTSWTTGTYTRNNGLPWYAGDPLVKYRFPLNKLALLQKMQGTATLSSSDTDNIAKYFGLDPVSDSNGLYRHWQYPTQSSKYLHTPNTILTLAQVAALGTPREPDFFELLQAGILNGSLGGWGRGDNPPYVSNSLNAQDFDFKTTIQILRIGANIINQWNSDSYPTTISYLTDTSGDTFNVYGISDLPYLTQMFLKAYSPNGNQTMPVYPYVYFQAWNPYLAPSPYYSTNYPSKFRIVPYQNTANPAYSDNFQLWLIVGLSTGTYKWAYIPLTSSWTGTGFNSQLEYFSSLATTGGGPEANSSSGLIFSLPNPQINYREPGLVAGTPLPTLNGTTTPAVWTPTVPLGGGSPPFPAKLAAISLPAITNYPPNGLVDTSAVDTPTPPTTNWTSSVMTNKWKVSFQTDATFVQQYQDSVGNWQTYGTFIGMNSQSVSAPTAWAANQWVVSTGSTSPNDVSLAKTDPRTYRFGLGAVEQQQSGFTVTAVSPNATNPPSLTPTSPAWTIYGSTPFGNSASTAALPYRMDYWVANNTNNPVQGSTYSAANSPYITDLDGTLRGADSAYAYSSSGSAWGSNPTLSGGSGSYTAAALPARPVMLHHPFNSVGDLGYAYRDDPWRTLDFMTPASADAGLLDLFSLSEAPVIAGRINPNTPYPQVIASLVSGATQSSLTNSIGPTATVPFGTAQLIGTNFVTFTATNPIANRAALVTSGAVSNVIGSGYLTGNGNKSYVKTEGESFVRAMSESSNTRTWNLLVDVIGQSGHFVNNSSPVTSGGTDNFVVDGERRYWLHIAIDRYTGKIVDEQLELVDQ